MKLVIQIPCHNEADNLPAVLAALPRTIEGVDVIEVLVIDDGSTDDTAAVARRGGVGHVVRFARRRGLARAFTRGLDESLRLGADVIVNTDGDNQYEGADIPELVAPVLEGKADIAVGDRDAGSLPHFSFLKRKLQRFGSWAVRKLSGTDVADAPSGFRAYSREAALRLHVMTDFTYTLETLIQAGKRGLAVVDVPVRARATERRSRLAPTVVHYLAQAGGTLVRAYALYEPLKVFTVLGGLLMFAGFMLGVRFLYYFFFVDRGQGHVQSLILAAILSIVGFQVLCLALMSDLLAGNRKFLEDVSYRLRKLEVADGMRRTSSALAGSGGSASGPEEKTTPATEVGVEVERARAGAGPASAGGES